MKQRNGFWRRRGTSGARAKKSWPALVGLLLLMASQSYGQFDVLLSPQVASVELRPGQRSLLTFDLTNKNRDNAVMVRIRAQDMYQAERGEYKLSDTTMPYSCVDWLTILDTLVELPAGGQMVQVGVGVEVPNRAFGGAYGAVVFEILHEDPRRPTGDAMGAHVAYRLQVPAWIEIEVKRSRGVKRRLEPGEISVTPTAEDTELKRRYGDRGLAISTEVANIGNIHVQVDGRLIIRDKDNRLVTDTRLGSGRGMVLPGAKLPLRTIMQLPPPGTYTIKTFVQYGGRSPAIAQSTFELTRERVSQLGDQQIARSLFVDLRPEKYENSIPGGGFRVFGLNVMNRDEMPVRVDIVPGRISYTLDGQMWVSEENPDSGRSCMPWLEIEPRQFEIRSNRAQNIRLTMSVPENASGGYYGCIVLNARPASDSIQGSLASPLYFPVYLTVPPDLQRSGEITEIQFDRPAVSAVAVKVKFRNTGNVHNIIRGGVQIDRWVEPQQVEGLEIVDTARFVRFVDVAIPVDSTIILPGQSRIVSSHTVDGLPPGRYKADARILYGTEELATMEKEFVVKESGD